jgi:hypothetical protein
MNKLTLNEQLKFYIQWCVDNKKAPQNYENLKEYLHEIGEIK